MVKKNGSEYVCQNCGAVYPKWQGKCDACGEWNTIVEEKVGGEGFSNFNPKRKGSLLDFVSLSGSPQVLERLHTNIRELDRVCGGGLVPGSVILVGGDPGIGKSTLLLQVCASIANLPERPECYYISGEEAADQVKIRARRLGLETAPVNLASATDVKDIVTTLEKTRAAVVVIDSIQTMYQENVSSAPGSVSQVREATGVLMRLAKENNITIFIVGHVTKEGTVAGPRVLEHMVDTVLYFEGDRHASYRILRGVKNRFGSTNEIGVFEMRKDGLAEVANPSEFMLNGKPEGASGSVVVCSVEGTRPILIEIQALVCRTNFGIPRRQTTGTDFNRVNLLMAVLEKRLGIQIGDCDAYVNIAGGMKINEPAIDLGIIMAIVSSYKNRPIDEKTIVFGEVGLSGEVRAVSQAQQRVQEARKLGYETVIMPKVSAEGLENIKGIKIIGVSGIGEAIDII